MSKKATEVRFVVERRVFRDLRTPPRLDDIWIADSLTKPSLTRAREELRNERARNAGRAFAWEDFRIVRVTTTREVVK